MKIGVLIERQGPDRVRASSFPPFAMTSEAATEKEAIAELVAATAQKLRDGVKWIEVDVTPDNTPGLPAPIFQPDDPIVQDWMKIMEENRRHDDGSVCPVKL